MTGNKEKDKKERSLIWLSIIVPACLISLIFKTAHRFPGDKHIFMVGDYYVQFMNYIVMFWRKLFSGNGLFYSFDIGLGAASWEHYAFYGFSPFNVVFILIKDADAAAFLLLVLKLCAASAAMHLFLKKAMRAKEDTAVFFSVSYALCAYAINYYFCIILMDYLYLLPIVMLMMVKFFQTGKSGGLAAAYAWSFLTAYYGGYMIGVFSFVCFAVMLLAGEYGISKKKLMLRYISAVMTAVLISAVITLPTAMAILAGRSGESGNSVNLSMDILAVIADLYPLRGINENTLQPSIYCGLPVLIFVTGYYCNGKTSRKEKMITLIPLFFLLVCTMFKPAYLMMHGFDEPDGYYFRFAFLYSFYLAAIAARGMENCGKRFELIHAAIVLLIEIIIVAAGYLIPEKAELLPGGWEAVMIFSFLLLYFIAQKYFGEGGLIAICVVLALELFINGYIYIAEDPDNPERMKENYELWNRHGTEAMEKIKESENEEKQFFRVNFRNGIWANDPMYFGYHGLSYFSSMEQRDTRRALQKLGYLTTTRAVAENGGSPFTEMIFSQKYRVQTDPDIRNENCEDVRVSKNEYVLPLAFMISDNTEKLKFGNDAFENQQDLVNAMLGHEDPIWDKYTGMQYTECDNISLSEENGRYIIKRNAAGEAWLTISADTEEDRDNYAYILTEFKGLDKVSPIVHSDKESEKAGLQMSSTLYSPAIIRLGNENGKSSLYILMKDDGSDEGNFEKAVFSAFNKEGLKTACDELKAGGLYISEMKDDDIRGSINVIPGRDLMFTSIPYDENWHITYDGSEAETFPLLDWAFLACSLPEGEHEIRIYYHNKFIDTGAVISLFGVIILFGMIMKERKYVENC